MSAVFETPDSPMRSAPQPAPEKKPRPGRRALTICLAALAVAGLIAVAFNVGGTRAEQKAAENPVVTSVSQTFTSRIIAPTPAPVTVTAPALPAVTVTAPAPAPVTVTAPAPPAVTVTAPPITVSADAGSGGSGSGSLSAVTDCEADAMELSDSGDYTGAMRKLAECARMGGN